MSGDGSSRTTEEIAPTITTTLKAALGTQWRTLFPLQQYVSTGGIVNGL